MHYLNTNTQLILFRDVLNSEIYVDKSMLIRKISPINDENALSCSFRKEKERRRSFLN